MAILNGIVTVVLVLCALVLIATVLLQPGESNGLGAIAGGAETFFGKNKAKTMEGKLALATKVSAAAFIVCALVIAVIG
jgi:preprotein translocase subunit SecG